MDTSTKGKLTRELMSHQTTKKNLDYMYICAYTVIEEITFFTHLEKRTLEPSSPKVPCMVVDMRYAT